MGVVVASGQWLRTAACQTVVLIATRRFDRFCSVATSARNAVNIILGEPLLWQHLEAFAFPLRRRGDKRAHPRLQRDSIMVTVKSCSIFHSVH